MIIPVESGIKIPSVSEMRALCENLHIAPASWILLDIRRILQGKGKSPGQQVQEAQQRLLDLQRFQWLTMHVRDTVWMHIERLQCMLHATQHSLSLTFPRFPFGTTGFMIDKHDLPEGISPLGDIPTHLKRRLSPALSLLLQHIEGSCQGIIAQIPDIRVLGNDPRIFGVANTQTRMSLFHEYEKRRQTWAQVVKYLDILDAYMESLLETNVYKQPDFFPISKRYRDELSRVATGEVLPAIVKIYENRKTIQARLDEDFWPEENFPNDTYDDDYETFCGGLGLIDFEDLQTEHPKAFDYWKKHIFRPEWKKKPRWFAHEPLHFCTHQN